MTHEEAQNMVEDFELACIDYERTSNRANREDRYNKRLQLIAALTTSPKTAEGRSND